MLANGERQVAPDLSGIRRDHVARYEWAAAMGWGTAVDVGCGIGYGASILADAGAETFAFDRDADALDYARAHYAAGPGRRLSYVRADADDQGFCASFRRDVAVAFEVIEHLADPWPMLRGLREGCRVLLASVPNESVFPFRNHKFHHRHYTREAFEALLNECGWFVTQWWGQAGPESEVARDVEGRTLIAVCAPRPQAQQGPRPAARPVPDHVALIGLGRSRSLFFDLACSLGGAAAWCDEVWGINMIGGVARCDRVFHMDDVAVQEARAAADPDGNIAGMLKWLKTHPGPVYTSVVRDGYPGLVAFPLEDVLNAKLDSNGGAPYFNTTTAYAVAYAIHIGVKRLSLFGVDYTVPAGAASPAHHKLERGRACVEFWLGVAAARGMEITIAETSSVLDACEPPEGRLYGYDGVDVRLGRAGGRLTVTMTPKALPTADEIDKRYAHLRAAAAQG